MPAILSPNPKRVRRFIINGQMYDGTAEDYFSGRAKLADLGGVGEADGVLPPAENEGAKTAE